MLVFEHSAYEILQESLNPSQSNFQKERSCLTTNLDTRGSGILNPSIQQPLPGGTPLGDLVFQRTPFKESVVKPGTGESEYLFSLSSAPLSVTQQFPIVNIRLLSN